MSAWYHGEVIDQVEAQLCLPWNFDPRAPLTADTVRREAHWHAKAIDTFLEVNKDSHDLIAGIHNLSHRIITELSDDPTIPSYLHEPITKDDLEPIKRYRKLMMIGRDGLMATSSFRSENGHPINRLCHNLGLIADTAGNEPKNIAATTDALKDMPGSLDYTVAEPIAVHRWLTERLSMVSLNLNDTDYSAVAYHERRKDFRRAVHIGLLSVVAHPTELKKVFAADGLALNTMYGDRHNEMHVRRAKAA